MVRRMAQPHQVVPGPVVRRACVPVPRWALAALILGALMPGAAAEQPADTGVGDQPGLSQECRVPGAQLYTMAKLGAVRTAPSLAMV